MNLLPSDYRSAAGPVVGLSLDGLLLPATNLVDAADWALLQDFGGLEVPATGEVGGFAVHAPSVPAEEREALRERLTRGASPGEDRPALLAAQAPNQATFDVTLVSPSSAIRRASVSELWSVCRFLGAASPAPGGIALVRTGVAPTGVGERRQAEFLSETLTTLDRMAGEQGAQVGLLNYDWLTPLSAYARLHALDLRNTGVALDVGHALDRGETWETVRDFIADCPLPLLHVRVPLDLPSAVIELGPALTAADFRGQVCLMMRGDSGRRNNDIRILLQEARKAWERALCLNADSAGVDEES